MNVVRDPSNVMHEGCLDLGNGMMYVIALTLRVLCWLLEALLHRNDLLLLCSSSVALHASGRGSRGRDMDAP